MKTFFTPILLILMMASGCVQISQDLSLNTDGSGTFDFMYAVKEKDLQRMKEVTRTMAAIDPELAQEDVDWMTAFDEAVIREEWEKSANEGVKLSHVSTDSRDGWRFMNARIDFDSLQQLFDCGMIEECHIALTRGPNGQYGFQQSIDIAKMSESMPAGMDINTLKPLVEMMLQDFRADITFRSPGRIIRSNADEVVGQNARWSIRGNEDDFIAKLNDFDVRLMFDGKGMTIADAMMLR